MILTEVIHDGEQTKSYWKKFFCEYNACGVNTCIWVETWKKIARPIHHRLCASCERIIKIDINLCFTDGYHLSTKTVYQFSACSLSTPNDYDGKMANKNIVQQNF